MIRLLWGFGRILHARIGGVCARAFGCTGSCVIHHQLLCSHIYADSCLQFARGSIDAKVKARIRINHEINTAGITAALCSPRCLGLGLFGMVAALPTATIESTTYGAAATAQ